MVEEEDQLEKAVAYGRALLEEADILRRENTALQQDVEAAEAREVQQAREHAAQLAHQTKQIADLEDAVAAAAAEKLQLHALLDDREAELGMGVEAHATGLQRELQQAREELQQQRARTADVEDSLASEQQRCSQLADKIGKMATLAEATDQKLGDVNEKNERSTEELTHLTAARREVCEENARLTGRVAKLQATLAETQEALDQAIKANALQQSVEAQLREELMRTQSVNAALQTKVDGLDRMVETIGSMAAGQGDGKELGHMAEQMSLGSEIASQFSSDIEAEPEPQQQTSPAVEYKLLALKNTLEVCSCWCNIELTEADSVPH